MDLPVVFDLEIAMSGGLPFRAGEPFQVVEVTKAIEGTQPPSIFLVRIVCEQFQGPPLIETLSFNSPGTEVFDAGGESSSCAVDETSTGGVSAVSLE